MTPTPNGGHERSLGALGVAHLDELAEPAASRASGAWPGSGSSRKRGGLPSRVVGAPAAGRGKARCAIDRVEPRQEIHEARQRGQATEPAAAAAQNPEVKARAKDIDARRVGVEELDRRLRQHERDVALEPVAQPPALVGARIGARAHVDRDTSPR